ncbi:probable malonyl-CoA-acyl carrier protein transacylase, mitochondrial [Anabrus simplex]|uniref:probable malonyl-CoA-acyl carrier protein transacylase, mitochondrial n=1 Tax=Anabrus simplex TaxID=316456 RepID=UPI0035A26C5D
MLSQQLARRALSRTSQLRTYTERHFLKDLLNDAAGPAKVDPEDPWTTSPYPHGAVVTRDQSLKSRRPQRDPRETSIILFPGQGAQFVGMGKDLLKFPIAKDLFEEANEILGYDLLSLCLNGPKEELDKTIKCQPAIFVSSLAALERLKEERPAAIDNCVAAAGFSIGEITALVFAGAITFERALELVKIRAEAMQIVADAVPGGMMTVFCAPDSQLGLACLQAKEWCLERGVENPECSVANYLFPQCKVVAGHVEALKFLESNAAHFKLKRLKRLPVAGAFHSKIMQPAVEPFKESLKLTKIYDPLIAVHSNVDGLTYRDARHVQRQLPLQICKPVKWEQTLHVLYERRAGEHFPRTFECGPGTSLKSVLKMVNAKAWDSCHSVNA